MKRQQLIIIIGFLILITIVGCGRRGSSTATINGVLTINGTPAPGKTVYLQNAIGGLSKPTVTDAEGRFTYSNIVPGNYQAYYVSATSPVGTYYSGGHEMIFQAITLTQNNRLDISAQMDIPEVPSDGN